MDAAVCIVVGKPANLQVFRPFVACERLTEVRVLGDVPLATAPARLATADVLAVPTDPDIDG